MLPVSIACSSQGAHGRANEYVTTIFLLSLIASILALALIQREVIARRQEASLKAHTDAMDDLSRTLNMCIDEVRSVQTYGLRIQK
jgi:hypothetical protein